MRRIALLLALCLAGCGDTLWAGLVPSLAPAAAEPEPAGPALRLTWRGRTLHAALVQETGERRIWRTAGRQVVETDGGRVVATAGFGEMLVATRFDGPDPLEDPAALLDHPAMARRMVDLMSADRSADGMRFGVQVECRLGAQPTADAALLLVEEQCRAERIGRFTNRFVVEVAGGAVVQARQWIGPGAPMLEIEFLGLKGEKEEPPSPAS